MHRGFRYNHTEQRAVQELQRLKKKQETSAERNTQPPSTMQGEAEQGHSSPVQDNSPQHPGGWFAKFFAEARPRELAKRVRAVRRAAATYNDQSENDRYLRLRAELENFKKRTAKEKEDLHRHALEGIMKDLLPVLDSFEKGFVALQDDKTIAQSSFTAGMQLVAEQLQKILTGHGLQVISSCGENFDPLVHQAIRREESADVDSEIVGEEFAKGYQLHGRLLRPAMVSVRVPKPPTD